MGSLLYGRQGRVERGALSSSEHALLERVGAQDRLRTFTTEFAPVSFTFKQSITSGLPAWPHAVYINPTC